MGFPSPDSHSLGPCALLFLESTKWILNLYFSLFPALLFSRQWPPRHQALAYSGQPCALKHESHQAKGLTKPTHQGPCFPTETFHSIGNEVTQQGTRGTSEKTLVPRVGTGSDVRRHGETWHKPPGEVTYARGSFVLEHTELKTKRKKHQQKTQPRFLLKYTQCILFYQVTFSFVSFLIQKETNRERGPMVKERREDWVARQGYFSRVGGKGDDIELPAPLTWLLIPGLGCSLAWPSRFPWQVIKALKPQTQFRTQGPCGQHHPPSASSHPASLRKGSPTSCTPTHQKIFLAIIKVIKLPKAPMGFKF